MRIEVLYPEVANLYGDLMNVEYLRRSCPEIEVTETHFGEMPRFLSEEVSLVYMGSVTEKGQELIVSELMPHKDRIVERIDAGQAFLVTGNALEIFGQYIAADDGRRFDCLGLFGTHAEQKMMSRYNALYLGSFEGADIVGFKSQFGHSYGDTDEEALFETERGDGLCPGATGEGIRKNNFMATYVIGPIVVLNPPFAKYLLRLMGVAEPVLSFEAAAYDVYVRRLEEYKRPETGFKY